jgi:hypothetical protein
MHLVRLYAPPACFRVSTWLAVLGPRMAGFRRNSPSDAGWGPATFSRFVSTIPPGAMESTLSNAAGS